MSSATSKFELPSKIDNYLALLSKRYAKAGHRLLQEIVVNAKVRVVEEWTSDNWNGGVYGHALYLTIPEALYLGTVDNKNELQNTIETDINQLKHVSDEYIATVGFEMEFAANGDWRRESGLLMTSQRSVPIEAANRIWQDGFRLFFSHKTEVKHETANIKQRLSQFGFTCFVAHMDIHPTQAWQDEIENALETMDGFVALLTTGFHDSKWTDQEVGYAVARGVPIIAVRLGTDPYGFIGKFQALSCGWEDAALEIAKLLISNARMFEAYLSALRQCHSFIDANILGSLLPAIKSLTPQQASDLVDAYNANAEIRGGFAFNGAKSGSYGRGLVHFLHALGFTGYRVGSSKMIESIALP